MDERVKLIAEITTKLLVGGYKVKGSNDLLDVYEAAAGRRPVCACLWLVSWFSC